MKTSLIENAQELKQIIIDMEMILLKKAIGTAREAYRRILEYIDVLIQRYRPGYLRIVHKRSTWYQTWLGHIKVTRRQYRGQDGND